MPQPQSVCVEECSSPHFIHGKMETGRTSAYRGRAESREQRWAHSPQALPAAPVLSSPLQSLKALLVGSRGELEPNSDASNKPVTGCICSCSFAHQSLQYFCLWTGCNWTTCTILYYCFPILCVASRYCLCIKVKRHVLGTRIAFFEWLHIAWFNRDSIGIESLLQ